MPNCTRCDFSQDYDNVLCRNCGEPLEQKIEYQVETPHRTLPGRNLGRHYYYIAFQTPLGLGGLFYNGDQHPLHPEAFEKRRKEIATDLSVQALKAGVPMIATDAIVYLGLVELPLDVAKARWPKDFE